MSVSEAVNAKLTVPLAELDRAALPLVGGKGANLGELARAGFPVPPGFCVTTAAYEPVAGDANLEPFLAALADTRPDDTTRLAQLAAAARAALLEAPVPENLSRAIAAAYGGLGDGVSVPVAVRSSATAEDLPTAPRASPASRTRTSTSWETRRCSTRYGAVGHPCGPTARSATGPAAGSTTATCASPSSCSGWSGRRSRASCSPPTR